MALQACGLPRTRGGAPITHGRTPVLPRPRRLQPGRPRTAPAKRATVALAQPVGELAVLSSALVGPLFRAVTAGVVIYAGLNYVTYRAFRNKVEQYKDKAESEEEKRNQRLRRLYGGSAEKSTGDQSDEKSQE